LKLRRVIDRTLLRLMLLGALNWTRVWYRPGKQKPGAIAQQWVKEIFAR